MCAHYENIKNTSRLQTRFGVDIGNAMGKADVWPSYDAIMVRKKSPSGTTGIHAPSREAIVGRFGLVPHWASDPKLGKSTYNARSETVATKPSFRQAWKQAQHCIIPAEAIYEPYWRTGKAVSARICRADGEPMGIAGLYSYWTDPQAGSFYSFTMLTINADGHPFMRQFHKSTDEKRMVVVLSEDQYQPWLDASTENSMQFMRAILSDSLAVVPPMLPKLPLGF